MLLNFPIPFGLDLSDLSFKIMALKKKTFSNKIGFSLSAYGEASVPSGYFEKGEIVEMEKIAEIIKKLVRKPEFGKIYNPYVISVLPETKSFIKLAEIPISKEENIPELIKEEIKKDIPISIEEAYVDWQIISQDSKKNVFKILIGIAPKDIIDDYTLLLKRAGLKPLAFEIESVAISRSLIAFNKKTHEKGLAILDLGATRSSIIIFDEDTLQYTSSIPIAGQEITNQIAAKLEISSDKAEKIKIACGLDNKKDKKIVTDVIKPFVEELTQKITDVMNFYQVQNNRKIGEILLCGGGAGLKGLDAFLYKALNTSDKEEKIKINIANPWVNTSFKTPPMPLFKSLAYTTAIGLALRSVSMKD